MRFSLRMVMLALCWMSVATLRAVQVDGVAGYANAHVITVSDVLNASRELQQMVTQRESGEAVNALYLKTLEEVINRKLIVDSYEDQREIKLPDEMVDERVQNVIRDMFKDDRTAFLNALAEDGQSEAAWRTQIREQMVVSAMRNLRVDSQIRISPLAVRERYEASPEAYAKPATVKYSMIVIAKGEGAEAQAVQAQKLAAAKAALAAGTSFGEVARQHSEDALAEKGGERDWTTPDMLRRELADFVMQAAPGIVSDTIDIGSQYVLLKLEERRDASQVTLETAYAEVERQLRQEAAQRVFEEWIARLRKDSFVRVLDEKPF